MKRSQQYSEEDYRQLESLMYDKMFLRLEDAQVKNIMLGNDGSTDETFFSVVCYW